MIVQGLGIDLVEVDRISSLMERTGETFKNRVFTPDEIAYCDSNANPAIHYAARWAAKEAVAKAIGTGFTEGVSWIEITVTRQANGAPGIHLIGKTAIIARERGIHRWLLALTHTQTTAAASAIALG